MKKSIKELLESVDKIVDTSILLRADIKSFFDMGEPPYDKPKKKCAYCEGKGEVMIDGVTHDTCHICNGTGEER